MRKQPYKKAFSEKMRIEAAKRYVKGELAKDLADEFGVAESTIYAMARTYFPYYRRNGESDGRV